jgi:hypothetical protein
VLAASGGAAAAASDLPAWAVALIVVGSLLALLLVALAAFCLRRMARDRVRADHGSSAMFLERAEARKVLAGGSGGGGGGGGATATTNPLNFAPFASSRLQPGAGLSMYRSRAPGSLAALGSARFPPRGSARAASARSGFSAATPAPTSVFSPLAAAMRAARTGAALPGQASPYSTVHAQQAAQSAMFAVNAAAHALQAAEAAAEASPTHEVAVFNPLRAPHLRGPR